MSRIFLDSALTLHSRCYLRQLLLGFAIVCGMTEVRADDEFKGVIGTTEKDSKPDRPAPVRPRAGSPNVVYILFDDVGFADFGSFGSEIETPNIDKLAQSGLRYNSFHTRAICSPTRAALLTGRNSHSVGMRTLANFAVGFPSGRGEVTLAAANVAEILRSEGYNTFAVGKWHLVQPRQTTQAGPFTHWPTQRGFDRFYGFLDAMTDHWHPELVRDNSRIEPPSRPGYHLSEDLIDQAIAYIRNQTASARDRPFFAYVALGAGHAPHHVHKKYIDKYIPIFEKGWDQARIDRLARQKELGIVPRDTKLPPANPGVRAWASLNETEKALSVRLQAAYAGFLDHADLHVGRLVNELKNLGRYENTIFVVASDNGASQEGNLEGTLNEIGSLAHAPESLEENFARIDDIGTERSFTNYALGWATVGNTPFRLYKNYPFGGGNNDPLIISWEKGIQERGAIRQQFVDVIDITPTILDIVGVEAPKTFDGVPQKPLEGASIRSTFADAKAPAARTTQYFELHGHRAIWKDGWKAVAVHERGTSFDLDRWELFHLREDFSESNDLADQQSQKLAELKEAWWREARAYGVLPLLEFNALDRDSYPKELLEAAARGQTRRFFPDQEHLPAAAAPPVGGRSYTITANLNRCETAVEGVILAQGELSGGYAFYVKDHRLVFDFNDLTKHRVVTSNIDVPLTAKTLKYVFKAKSKSGGRGTLSIDGQEVGSLEYTFTPTRSISWEGLDVGRDRLSPVTSAYADRGGFPFTTGALSSVDFVVEPANLKSETAARDDAR
jgi:arylsulfatase